MRPPENYVFKACFTIGHLYLVFKGRVRRIYCIYFLRITDFIDTRKQHFIYCSFYMLSPLSPVFPFHLRSLSNGKGLELHICLMRISRIPGKKTLINIYCCLSAAFLHLLYCFYHLNRVKDCIGTDLDIQEQLHRLILVDY